MNNFSEWRTAAREYLQADVAPINIQWMSAEQVSLFPSHVLDKPANASTKSIAVSQRFMSQLKQASCYIGNVTPEAKWALFYALLWRITKVNRNIMSLKSDVQVQRLEKMVKSVNRDMHKMKAFVRFKTDVPIFSDTTIEGQTSGNKRKISKDDVHYSAWFEPEHAIIEAIAPFFVKRFTGMNWSILTPHGCAHWNQQRLIHSPGIIRPNIQEDEFDDFWRAYYRSIFNPARLKEQAMRSEMPKKYWKYLPEAQCIGELATGAAARVEQMTDTKETDSERVRNKSKQVVAVQDQLRSENRK